MKKPLLFLIFLSACYLSTTAKTPNICTNQVEKCDVTTDYSSYVECIRRTKRSIQDCDNSCEDGNCCNECDCDSCSGDCNSGSCNSCCTSCCSNCQTNHCCHKTCHAKCKTSGCRKRCRHDCYEGVSKTTAIDIAKGDNKVSTSHGTNSKHNITTIIHLNNVINNTNLIDVPITLNNTNINNITIEAPDAPSLNYLPPISHPGRSADRFFTNEKETLREIIKEVSSHNQNGSSNCCSVISPRECVPINEPPFSKCYHYRAQQCGDHCTAPVVHVEPKQVCQMTPNSPIPSCQQQLIYIPQPQPRCSYQSVWPYVSCSINQVPDCQGCYGHYTDQTSTTYQKCASGCYDQGYGFGSMYRQGPFYRPNYYHTPPCYQLGGCGVGDGGGYGGQQPPQYGGYGPPIGGPAPMTFQVSAMFGNSSPVLVPEPYLLNNPRMTRGVEIEVEIDTEANDKESEINIGTSS